MPDRREIWSMGRSKSLMTPSVLDAPPGSKARLFLRLRLALPRDARPSFWRVSGDPPTRCRDGVVGPNAYDTYPVRTDDERGAATTARNSRSHGSSGKRAVTG